MVLTLLIAGPLLLVSTYLGFSSLEIGMTFREWLDQPKAVACLVCMGLTAFILTIDIITLLS